MTRHKKYSVVNDIKARIAKNSLLCNGSCEHIRHKESCDKSCKGHKKYFMWRMTRIYLSQKMSYPVTDDIRMHVTKNIFVADSANIFIKEYPMLRKIM